MHAHRPAVIEPDAAALSKFRGYYARLVRGRINRDTYMQYRFIRHDIEISGFSKQFKRLLRNRLSSSSREYPCTGYRPDGWRGETQKKALLAKLEEEEGGQDVAREQLRGAILVLMMHLPMPGWSVGGGMSYRRRDPCYFLPLDAAFSSTVGVSSNDTKLTNMAYLLVEADLPPSTDPTLTIRQAARALAPAAV